MKEWKGTRHCPVCDDVELATGVIDDEGSIHTWCLNCKRVLIKYPPHLNEPEWVDPEWEATEPS
jgi:hypothetical protein